MSRQLPGRCSARSGAFEILDVMAVLVGDDVGLGERPAGGAELRPQFVEEAEIDVDVAVFRAVERADLGRREPAAGVQLRREEAGRRRIVGLPAGAERLGPERLDAVDVADDPALLRRVRVGAGLARRPKGGCVRSAAGAGPPAPPRSAGDPPRSTYRMAITSPMPPPPTTTPRPRPLDPRMSSTCDGSSFAPGSKVMGRSSRRCAGRPLAEAGPRSRIAVAEPHPAWRTVPGQMSTNIADDDEPDRPGDVGDRHDGAGQRPTVALVGPHELESADEQGDARSAGPRSRASPGTTAVDQDRQPLMTSVHSPVSR